MFFLHSFSIPFPLHFSSILWRKNGIEMERYIPLFVVKMENRMELDRMEFRFADLCFLHNVYFSDFSIPQGHFKFRRLLWTRLSTLPDTLLSSLWRLRCRPVDLWFSDIWSKPLKYNRNKKISAIHYMHTDPLTSFNKMNDKGGRYTPHIFIILDTN